MHTIEKKLPTVVSSGRVTDGTATKLSQSFCHSSTGVDDAQLHSAAHARGVLFFAEQKKWSPRGASMLTKREKNELAEMEREIAIVEALGRDDLRLRDRQELEDKLVAVRARRDIRASAIDWLKDWGWTSFITLSFNPKKYPNGVSKFAIENMWRRKLVEPLNEDLHGSHYRRKVGHSYFDYLLAVEPHKSGLNHAHALVAGRINFDLLHSIWRGDDKHNLKIGMSWIEKIEQTENALDYVLKYVTKTDGMPLIYRANDKRVIPSFQPSWFSGG